MTAAEEGIPMPERRMPTLADARRQVRVRGTIGGLLIGLSLIFLLLVLVKHLYHTPAGLFFPPVGPALHRLIDPLIRDWLVLDLLWRSIPPWQPASPWELVYAVWGAMVVTLVGKLLLRSASARRAQITEFRQEMQREAWRQQARAAQGLAPDDRGSTTMIAHGIWHQYMAPPESWSQTLWGVLILGLIVALVSGPILLYLEYAYFQGPWPSSRN
jgi:hypothetical protein